MPVYQAMNGAERCLYSNYSPACWQGVLYCEQLAAGQQDFKPHKNWQFGVKSCCPAASVKTKSPQRNAEGFVHLDGVAGLCFFHILTFFFRTHYLVFFLYQHPRLTIRTFNNAVGIFFALKTLNNGLVP